MVATCVGSFFPPHTSSLRSFTGTSFPLQLSSPIVSTQLDFSSPPDLVLSSHQSVHLFQRGLLGYHVNPVSSIKRLSRSLPVRNLSYFLRPPNLPLILPFPLQTFFISPLLVSLPYGGFVDSDFSAPSILRWQFVRILLSRTPFSLPFSVPSACFP